MHLTQLGKMFLYENASEIVGIFFDCDKLSGFEENIKKHFGEIADGESELLLQASIQIDEYLQGSRKLFEFALAPYLTEFQQKVFAALSQISYGETATYMDLAEKIGMPSAYRAVGNALSSNPVLIAIPCHRINARGGMVSGYAGGIPVKRKLLQLEADKTVLDNTEIKSQNELQNPLLTEYIRKNIRVSGKNASLEKYAYEHNVPISKPETLSFIECLLTMNKPQKILEIGAAIGYSALFMQDILPDAQITTIERDSEMCTLAKQNLQGSGIKLICGDALEELEKLDGEFDFVFVDAAKGQYINFYPNVMRLLKKSGVALYDNVLYKGLAAGTKTVAHKHRTITRNLEKFNFDACNDENAVATLIPVGDGLLLSIKK